MSSRKIEFLPIPHCCFVWFHVHCTIFSYLSVFIISQHFFESAKIRGILPLVFFSVEVCRDDQFVAFISPAVCEYGRIFLCQRFDITVSDNIRLFGIFSEGDQLLLIVEDRVFIFELVCRIDLFVVAVYRDPRLRAIF